MAEELLSLKWNNHQAHFVDILTFLREQEIFVDATLACGGKLYPAHKFVLSTCSDYFKQMFTKNPSKHPIVFMKDVSCRDLEALLDFMYNGEVNVPQSSLGSLIKTAEGLQIKGLAVPDDPPTKRERKDTKSSHDSHHSPPPKRRARDRSPPLPLGATHSSSSHTTSTPTASKSRSPPPPPTIAASSSSSSSHSSQSVMPPVEATLDEDSRTSVHSGQSEQNTSVTTPSLGSKPQPPPPPVSNQLSSSSQENQQIQHDASQSSQGSEEPSPGPSGLHRSKEEVELDIKQEDFVEIGDEDEGDWGVEGEGGGDSSMGSENPPNFPEVMLPTDGSVPPAGDPAMRGVTACGARVLATPAGPGASRLALAPRGLAPSSTSPSSSTTSSTSSAAAAAADLLALHHHHHHHQHHHHLQHHSPTSPKYHVPPFGGSGGGSGSGLSSAAGGGGVAAAGTAAAGACDNGVGGGYECVGGAGAYGGGGDGGEEGGGVLHHLMEVAAAAAAAMSGVAAMGGSGGGGGGASAGGGVDDVAERPFPCGWCEARFKKKQHLQNHERIHTGEKYVCVVCGQGFSRMHILKHHVEKKHHPAPSPALV
ncbi:uncharacterized protein LOC143031107 isoform X3 [Oratosquilla oratoria]|uniref:uncharacterized protein LOC143031107 isoform X3 n=1 Tax=Oratosquilla oratoria TaxID=337810 RepID=UPI003F768808